MSVSVNVTSSAQFFKNVSTDIIQLRVFLAFPLSLIVIQYLYKLGVQLEACYIQSELDRSLSDHFRAFHSFGPILVKIDPNWILKSPAHYPMCLDSQVDLFWYTKEVVEWLALSKVIKKSFKSELQSKSYATFSETQEISSIMRLLHIP